MASEPQVFFNYRRSDSGPRAERLCDALRYAFGPEQVFKDNDTIGPGSDFADAIVEALARAELVIAVIGATWLTVTDAKGRRRLEDPADYVRRELEIALDRGVPIIPVLLEGAGAPNSDELPESLRGLVAHQAFVLRDEGWFDRARGPLVESVRTLAAVERERRERAAAGLGVGASFGPFRLDELLEEGSTGARYRAYDNEQRRTVAVQILAPDPSADPRFREEFLQLAATVAEIDEPHVVPVLSHGEHDGRLFVAIALPADGVQLPTAIAVGGVFSDDVAVAAVEDIAEALDALHANGIAGIDLWPSDVLRARRGSEIITLLLPFGVFRPGDRPTKAGQVEYAAPERLLGDAVDERSDVYVLACMLVECLTADPPYGPPDDPAAIIAGHLKGPIPRPTDVYLEIPVAMDKVVRRGMAKKSDRRYPAAGALAAAARAALTAPPEKALTAPAATPSRDGERPPAQPVVSASPPTAGSSTAPTTGPSTAPTPARTGAATTAPTTASTSASTSARTGAATTASTTARTGAVDSKPPATDPATDPALTPATGFTAVPATAPAATPVGPTTPPPGTGAPCGPSSRRPVAARVRPAFDDLVRKPAVRVLGRWPTAALWLGVALGSLALVAWWLVGALWQTGLAGKEAGVPFTVATGQFLLGVVIFPLAVALLVALMAVIGFGLSSGFDWLIARRASGAAARDDQGDVEIGVVCGVLGVVIIMLFAPLATLARAVESGRVPSPTDGHWLAAIGGTAVILLLTWIGLSSAVVLVGRTARGS